MAHLSSSAVTVQLRCVASSLRAATNQWIQRFSHPSTALFTLYVALNLLCDHHSRGAWQGLTFGVHIDKRASAVGAVDDNEEEEHAAPQSLSLSRPTSRLMAFVVRGLSMVSSQPR